MLLSKFHRRFVLSTRKNNYHRCLFHRRAVYGKVEDCQRLLLRKIGSMGNVKVNIKMIDTTDRITYDLNGKKNVMSESV